MENTEQDIIFFNTEKDSIKLTNKNLYINENGTKDTVITLDSITAFDCSREFVSSRPVIFFGLLTIISLFFVIGSEYFLIPFIIFGIITLVYSLAAKSNVTLNIYTYVKTFTSHLSISRKEINEMLIILIKLVNEKQENSIQTINSPVKPSKKA